MYSQKFYAHNIRATKNSAERIVKFITKIYYPLSVIDLGSSAGLFLREFIDIGISDVIGVDGPWISADDLVIPSNKFIRHDFSKPLNLEHKYDLAMSLEVFEHLDEGVAKKMVEELSKLSNVILFSAAAPGQGGTHHVNEQWPAFWASEFRKYDFDFIDIRPYIWDDNLILPWYRQNLILYVKRNLRDKILDQIVKLHMEGPLSLIHPEMTYLSLFEEDRHLLVRFALKIGTFLTRAVRAYSIQKKW